MMMNSIGERYFEWLVSQINVTRSSKQFTGIFRWMYHREFVWLVPNDDNRIGDAIDLRKEFWENRTIPQNGVSILEVIVALSRRAAFVGGGEAPDWAWIFIKNLGLNKFHDPLTYRKDHKIEEILETFVYRLYAPDGVGGLFPLLNPPLDQTKVELWYQMHAYINEKIPI
jgi:hypothetical protein